MIPAALLLALLIQTPAPAKNVFDIPLVPWSGKKTADYDNRVFAIRVSINGGPTLLLGLDSSIGTVVLSETKAAGSHISPGAQMTLDWVGGQKVTGRWFRGAKLTTGQLTSDVAYGLVVQDAALASFRPLDGLLGLSFLQSYMWTVDPKRGVLTLAPPDSTTPLRPSTSIPFTIDRTEGIQLKALFGGKPHMLTVMTGLGDVFFDKDLAKRLGIEGIGPVRTDGTTPYQEGPTLAIQLEGLKVAGVRVFIAQQSGWHHLGQSFLNRFIATWDMKRQKVLLSEP